MAKVIDVPGYGQTEFPDDMDDAAIVAAIQKNMVKPSAPKVEANTRFDSFLRGMKDPVDAGAQMLTHMLPDSVVAAGNQVNNWLAEHTGMVSPIPEGGLDQQLSNDEATYQAQRAAAGRDGLDGARMAGNVAATLIPATRLTQPASMMGRIGLNSAAGAGMGALNPVYSGDFAQEKIGQAGMGALTGLVASPLTEALSRVALPKAATNPDLQLLQAMGVKPTVGQAGGGWMNIMEEKAQMLPIMGDSISSARRRARDEFNLGVLNHTVKPVGGSVDEIGHAGITKAGDQISAQYNAALRGLGGVTLDNQAKAELANLTQMAANLPPQTKRQFNNMMMNKLHARLSPNSGMTAETFKIVDSDLGSAAASYRSSSVASERELGDALAEAQRVLRESVARQDPQYADALRKADEAWSMLVRVENAGKKSAMTEGVFTPGQLMQAVREGDRSVRKRAVARGDALLQDYAGAGQRVLGNKYPDSGTAGRLALGGVGLSTGAVSPAIPAALITGAGAYTSPVQQLALALMTKRPQRASKLLADAIRNSAPLAAMPATQAMQQ